MKKRLLLLLAVLLASCSQSYASRESHLPDSGNTIIAETAWSDSRGETGTDVTDTMQGSPTNDSMTADAGQADRDNLNMNQASMAATVGVLGAAAIVLLIIFVRHYRDRRSARGNAASDEFRRVSEQLTHTRHQLNDKSVRINRLCAELNASTLALGISGVELGRMADRITEANAELALSEARLAESRLTKEKYASLFMAYISSTVTSLQHYQNSLRNLVAGKKSHETIMKKLDSMDVSDILMKNFYRKFDSTILEIYPSFVEKLNALLKPDEQIVLKSDERLNTELRMFALMRLGIDDISAIAAFLRCTPSTVYTYRSKMRRRALNPDTFESDVMSFL